MCYFLLFCGGGGRGRSCEQNLFPQSMKNSLICDIRPNHKYTNEAVYMSILFHWIAKICKLKHVHHLFGTDPSMWQPSNGPGHRCQHASCRLVLLPSPPLAPALSGVWHNAEICTQRHLSSSSATQSLTTSWTSGSRCTQRSGTSTTPLFIPHRTRMILSDQRCVCLFDSDCH